MTHPITPARRIIDEHLRDPEGRLVHGPRLHPCVCGCGLHAHAGRQNTGGCGYCRCARYRRDTHWQLAYDALDAKVTGVMASSREYKRRERAAYLADNPMVPGQWSLGPSDAGNCRRAIWYRNQPPANLVRAYSPTGEADMGDLFHEELGRRLKALYPWQEFERWISVKGLDRQGRLDRWDPVVGELEDFKTCGDYVANRVDDFGPPLDDWKQTSLYGLALEDEGHAVATLRLTYIHRANGQERGPFERPYDREFAEAARQELLEVASTLDLVHAETEAKRAATGDPDAWVDPDDLDVLPRDRKGPSTDEICRRCPFRLHCWNMAEAADNGRSPESWTQLGDAAATTDDQTGFFTDEPTVWSLTNARELADLATATGKDKDEAEALIQGLAKGRYGERGEYTVYSQDHGRRPQYKAYADALAANAALPPEQQVDPATIEMPTGAPSVKTHVKRTPMKTLEREAKLRGEVITLPHPETGGAA